MNTTIEILMTIFLLAGVCLLTMDHNALKRNYINALYLLCGVLAWYTVETAEHGVPIYSTMLTVLLLCVLPMIIDGLIFAIRAAKNQRLHHEKRTW